MGRKAQKGRDSPYNRIPQGRLRADREPLGKTEFFLTRIVFPNGSADSFFSY